MGVGVALPSFASRCGGGGRRLDVGEREGELLAGHRRPAAARERRPMGTASVVTASPAAAMRGRLAHVVLTVAAVTVMARVVGFVRVLVFAHTVGPSCLGDTYFTANTIPNILFDIVAGGALSGLAVPVLAAPVD